MIMKSLIAGLAMLALGACSAAQVAQTDTAINTGCVVAPLVVGLNTPQVSADCAAAQVLEPVVGAAVTK